MATIEQFEELKVRQQARRLVQEIYRASNEGSFAKDFPPRNQIRSAAISVTSNIAEGFERDGRAEFLQFLSIAKGSCGEVRSQLYHALDEGYISDHAFAAQRDLCLEVSRMLCALMSYLKQSPHKGVKYSSVVKETTPSTSEEPWFIDDESLESFQQPPDQDFES